MKLKNKAFVIFGLASLVYLVPAAILPEFSLITVFSIASSIIALLCIYLFFIKRINKLNNKISSITSITDNITDKSNNFNLNSLNSSLSSISLNLNLHLPENVKISKNDEIDSDEIDSIARNVNTLLKNIQNTLKMEEEKIKNDSQVETVETQNLKKINFDLKQEISSLTRVKKNKEIEINHLNQVSEIENKAVNEKNLNQDIPAFQRTDDLTSLPNSIYFNETLNKAITYSKRRNKNLAVLLVDLDLFKLVNDTFGRENGDLILKEMSKRFTNVLRKEDVIAKLDGDEFIILLNDIGKPKFASMVAEKILNACTQLLKIDSHEFTLTASIGISIYPNDGESLESLLENAERALFKAKQSGGNTFQFHTEEIHLEAMEYTQMESALRNAIQNNELSLYYQPRFRTSTGHITTVEALMRWEHPTLGIISPMKFIQVAEDSGLIMQIGEWALREVCQRIIYWQTAGYEHLTVALKLSPKQYNHPDLIKMMKTVFSSFEINPKYIELEITEKTIMDNIELASNTLEKIKATGVELSIDHFGKGYTSISYLKQLPISSIKIDQSYIKGVPNIPNDTAITNALIALAHNLGLEVIAEGVETAEQVQYLTSQNCDLMQGYFLSHPVSAQKVVLQFRKLSDEVLG